MRNGFGNKNFLILKRAVGRRLFSFLVLSETRFVVDWSMMKMFFSGLTIFLFVVMQMGCDSTQTPVSRVVLRMKGTSLDSVFLTKIGFLDLANIQVAAKVLYSLKDSLVFLVPKSAEGLYRIRFMYSGKQAYFIPDKDSLQVWIDNKTGFGNSDGSPATAAALQLLEAQTKIATRVRLIKRQLDSVIQEKPAPIKMQNSLIRKLLLNDSLSQNMIKTFCDTVHNPAAFMLAYNSFLPSDRYRSSFMLIQSAAKRFPNFKPLQELKKDMALQTDIYEHELQLGDQMPFFSLPDLNGNPVSSKAWQGKYYLLDFWASWCPSCNSYQQVKKELFQKMDRSKFIMISVAMDDNIETCRNIIAKNGLVWTQLLDTKMWKGPAVRALKFDSIPFNFLISPEGKILDKAIPGDSLVRRVKSLVR